MIVFIAIFEVNSNIGKLWDLQGHFDEKDFNQYHFLLNNSVMYVDFL